MVVHRDNTVGLGDGKCIYLEDSEVNRYTETKMTLVNCNGGLRPEAR